MALPSPTNSIAQVPLSGASSPILSTLREPFCVILHVHALHKHFSFFQKYSEILSQSQICAKFSVSENHGHNVGDWVKWY